MKSFILLAFLLVLLSCSHIRNTNPAPAIAEDALANRYSDTELVKFLDSIGRLDPQKLKKGITSVSDSVVRNQETMAVSVNPQDLQALKKQSAGRITNFALFRKLFPQHSEFFNEDMMPGVVFHQFSKDGTDKFAIEFNGGIGSWVYFFSGNKIVAHHNIYHKYGLEIASFVNTEGRTVIYYNVNYVSGTDVWQDNNNFYMYHDDTLIPVLNVPENIYLGHSSATRNFSFESSVASASPLSLKIVYGQKLTDYKDDALEYVIVKDSAIVRYNWDDTTKSYIPDFGGTKLNSNILLSYYITGNELLFINTHYARLKEMVQQNDTALHEAVMQYLGVVKSNLM